MKKLILVLLVLGIFIPSLALADVWVNGYTRSNGTYVQGHYRSSPDGNPYNNYSYPGNTNPYTGKVAPGNPSTYLNNYYNTPTYSLPSYTTPTYTIPSYTTPSYLLPSYTSTPSSYYPSYTSSYSSSRQEITGGYKSYGILFCDDGYYENDDGDECLKAPKNSTANGISFYCNDGYEKKESKCVIGVKDSTYKNGLWTCKSGLYLNNDETKCITPEAGCQEDNTKSHYADGSCYTCPDNLIFNPKDLKCNTLETSAIKANGCPKEGKGRNVYTNASCKKK